MRLSSSPHIKKLIPGRLSSVTASCDKFEFRLTVQTSTGWKALARNNSNVQEVFVIADDKEAVEGEIKRVIDKWGRKFK